MTLNPLKDGRNPFVLPWCQVVNYSESRTAEQICESASKMITFIDLAGHHKYLKTTIFGLTSYCPDFAMLVVSANTGIGRLGLAKHIMFTVTASYNSQVYTFIHSEIGYTSLSSWFGLGHLAQG